MEEKVDLNPIAENVALLEICKTNYEKAYEYITKGSILRSRVRWYEEGEKNTKYFLNLENHKNKKSCVRKIYNKESKLTYFQSSRNNERTRRFLQRFVSRKN